MFHYLGRKSNRFAKIYPEPKYNTIIEPFAGSAGYALHHYSKKVILCEKDPVIYRIWDYLINKATPRMILKLPILEIHERTTDEKYNYLKPVEKDLIGFFINTARASPAKKPTPSDGFRKWNEKHRNILAENVKKIKHWKIIHGSYEQLYNYKKVTWFIDPPYQGHGGQFYKHSNKDIDYKSLASWVRSRNGEVIVCENSEAKWLPFRKLKLKNQQNDKMKYEMMYHKINS